MEKVENTEEIIAYLKQSREAFIMRNREIGEKIALRYINDKILDYEDFVVLEGIYEMASNPVYLSDGYGLMDFLLAECPADIWNDLAATISDQIQSEMSDGFDEVARGFVEGVMSFWSEIKDQVVRD